MQANATSCTLRDLESFALERCPLGYRVLADASKYKFERKIVFQQSTMTARKYDLLHVGYYSRSAGDHAYAEFQYQSDSIVYYRGEMGSDISAAAEAEKKTLEDEFPQDLQHIDPFKVAIGGLNGKKAKQIPRKTSAQKTRRSRLGLLIKFAFLLTGRVESITYIGFNGVRLRNEFMIMCSRAQHQATKKSERERKSSNRMAVEKAQPTMHNAWSDQPQDGAEGAFTLATRASKRKVVDLTHSDDEDEPSMQGT
jgi:hypothetical protein